MRKRNEKIAFEFHRLALELEKILGLGGKKSHRFVETLSKNMGPLLDKLEATILISKSLPFGMMQKMFKAYLKEVAKEAGVSLADLTEVTKDLGKILKEWFKPEEIKNMALNLAQSYLFRPRIESETDEFGMDPSTVEAIRPLFQFLYYDYWRVNVKGIENIPKSGRALLIGNHSGGLPYDGSMITVACLNEHKAHRDVRFLIEDFVYHFPFLGTLMNRLGAVRACPENATMLLKKGKLVLVFPEGVKGLGKVYADRYKLERFGRGGFIKIAIKTQTPIVPVAVIGAEEIHPIIWKSSMLAKAMGIPYLPVTPTFPWLGPMGLIPLPSKWTIQFGKPISFKRYKPSQTEDGLLVQELSEKVRTQIQKMVDGNLKKRKSVWLG